MGGINIIYLVLELGHITQHGKAMGKTARNEHLTAILGTQFNRKMTSPCRAAMTQVHNDIQDMALRDTHQFGLASLTTLEVKSPYYAMSRERLIILNKIHMSHMVFKLILLEHLAEIAALVPEPLGFDDPYAHDFLFDKCHVPSMLVN